MIVKWGINVADLGLQWKDIRDNAVHGLADVSAVYYHSKALDNCFQLLSRQTLKEKKIASLGAIMKQSPPFVNIKE